MVVQVRYYEHLYILRDDQGERIYAGTDEKTAESILSILNGYRKRPS